MKQCHRLFNKTWCHVGMGKFHRAHQARCLDKLQQLNKIYNNWKIKGVGLHRSDKQVWNHLRNQKFLYTLEEKTNDSTHVHFIKSIHDMIYLPIETNRMDELLNDDLKCITTTITENGYFLNEEKKLLHHQDIQYDIKTSLYQRPYTIYGLLHYILYNRYLMNLPGICIMSCDNMSKNSELLKNGLNTFIQYLTFENKHIREHYLKWVHEENVFPITMVDRITPNICNKDYIQNEYRFVDNCSVVSEKYFEWVIQDNFVNSSGKKLERPPFELVDGVSLKKDISVHERMKLRFVNGGHLIIAFQSAMHDLEFVHNGMYHPEIKDNFKKYLSSIMGLFSDDEQQEYNINAYIQSVEERFENIHLQDTIQRLCMDGGNKIKYVMSGIMDDVRKDYANPILDYHSIFLPIRFYFEYLDKGIYKNIKAYDILGNHIIENKMNIEERFDYLFGDASGCLSNKYKTIYNS